MNYILYNLTHLIPAGCDRRNIGIMIPDDRRTLSPGRHRILNTISDTTKRYAKKRILFNGIEYEILRVVETKDLNVTSPGDRKKLEETLDTQEREIKEKHAKILTEEKNVKEQKEREILRKKQVDIKQSETDQDEMLQKEHFKKNTESINKFGHNDGKPSPNIETEPIFTDDSEVDKEEEAKQLAKEEEEVKQKAAVKLEAKEAEAKTEVADKEEEEEEGKQEIDDTKKEMNEAAKNVDKEMPKKITFDDEPTTEKEEVKKKGATKKKSSGKKRKAASKKK